MSHCPACGEAYAQQPARCPRCGVPLGTRPPEDEAQGEWLEGTEIAALADEVTGLAVRTFLAEAGVEARIREIQASFYGTVLNVKGTWGKLVVPQEQAEKARQLLAEFWRQFEGR